MVAYGMQKIGITGLEAWFAQFFGSSNDATGQQSWDLGWKLAKGDISLSTLGSQIRALYAIEDDKPRKLWPNTAAPDNFVPSYPADYNTQYTHPGFLEIQQP